MTAEQETEESQKSQYEIRVPRILRVARFEDVKEHSSMCRTITYRVDPLAEGSFKRVRIRAGMFAWDEIVAEAQWAEIGEWLESVEAVKIVAAVSADEFFG
jgi:hypothetical protein